MLDRVIKGHGSLVAATLSINLLALALPLMSRQIVKHGQQDGSGFTILSLVLIVIVASVGENLFRLGRSLVPTSSKAHSTSHIRSGSRLTSCRHKTTSTRQRLPSSQQPGAASTAGSRRSHRWHRVLRLRS